MKARPDELDIEFEQDGVEIRSSQWGDMHVARYALPPGTDLSPFFAALPAGLCSGNHWGIVLEGSLHLRYADGTEETTVEGEIYYWEAGHTAWTDEGVVFVAVTPLAEVRRMAEQLQAAATG